MEAVIGPVAPVGSGNADAPRGSRLGPFVRILLLLAVVGGLVVFGFLSLVRREQHVALGGEIVHDDFGFRVRDATASETLGQPELHAAGRFVVVRFDVNNRAKRVPFDLATWTPVLVDAAGTVYQPDLAGESALAGELALGGLRAGTIRAGASQLCRAVYDVPASARGLSFQVSWGGEAIDALDHLIFGPKEIALGDFDAHSPR